MARLFFFLASVVFSTSALQCYMTQSPDPNYIPSGQELGLCPPSSTACFRTVLNTTYQGFQVMGASYGCDSPTDSLCQDGTNPECQFSLSGTCCCHSDGCNQGNTAPIIAGNSTSTTSTTASPAKTTTSPAKTTPHGLRCYIGVGEGPNAVTNCALATTHCFNMTVNGTRFSGCDDGNQTCTMGPGDSCLASDDGTVLCCCTEDCCNGNSYPLSNSTAYPPPPNTPVTANDTTVPTTGGLICYNGLTNETCTSGTKECYTVSKNNQTVYGCDYNNLLCQNVPRNMCKESLGVTVCCCTDNYCNGLPTSKTTPLPNPARMACYSGENSNIAYNAGYNDIQQCRNGVTSCYRTFLANELYYGCDSQNHCSGVLSGYCVDSPDFGRICCCGSELCNGTPFGDYEPLPKSAYAFTIISTVLTIAVYNFM